MAFIDILGLGASATFGIGVGARAFSSILVPTIGKIASTGLKASSFAARKGLLPTVKTIATHTPSLISSVAKTGHTVGAFALRHPYMTMAGLGTGAYLATNKSPYDSPSLEGRLEGVRLSASFNEEQAAAQALNEAGVAPMGGIISGAAMRNQRLMESTVGLTQGLWSSRH
jgi:hypothetical protein